MISLRSTGERRKNPRFDNNIPLKICGEGGDLVTETKNISRSGAYCRIDKALEPMTKLNIHLLLSFPKAGKTVTRKVSCEGVVVRSEPASEEGKYNIAVFFSDITKRDAECITDYVESFLHKSE